MNMKDSKRRNLCIRGLPHEQEVSPSSYGFFAQEKSIIFLVQKISLLCYPFRPEVLIPSTRYFWKNKKMTTAGKTESVAIANIAP